MYETSPRKNKLTSEPDRHDFGDIKPAPAPIAPFKGDYCPREQADVGLPLGASPYFEVWHELQRDTDA